MVRSDAINAIDITDLRKEYVPALSFGRLLTFRWTRQPVVAIDRMNLSIEAGTITAIIGPNGAGKTSLLRLAGGLLLPTAGTLRVLGKDTTRHPEDVRAMVGYCMTDGRSFFLRLSGRENLRFFAAMHGQSGTYRDANVSNLLDVMELGEVADRQVLSYSDGMKQRLALARALLGAPRVLLLDEISRGLDPRLRDKVHRHVREMATEKGVTVLMASHNLDEVQTLSSRVLVMDRGCIVADGHYDQVAQAVKDVFADRTVETTKADDKSSGSTRGGE
jgi:ABC-2 type transport system ATP-binding protein